MFSLPALSRLCLGFFLLLTVLLPAGYAPAQQAAGIVDVTAAVKAQIQNDALEIVAETALAGADPAQKTVKRLAVIYDIGAGDQIGVANEGETLLLTAPDGGTLIVKKALYGNIAVPAAASAADIAALLATDFPPGAPPQITLPRPALLITPTPPIQFEKRDQIYFADFGADAFGNLQITFPAEVPAGIFVIRLGEKLATDGTIDRKPPGSVNYQEFSIATQPGKSVYSPLIPLKDGYQKSANAIKTPASIGNIAPFRYAEIEGSPVALELDAVSQQVVHTAFDDDASSFVSSNDTLNQVWDLCKHTMKATTAFGVYIDGDRERRPYEADAYINFLSHLATDFNPGIGRYSLEYLLAHPTWPTEWSFHMPMLAEAEYDATGEAALAARNYDALKKKLMLDKVGADGLLRASAIVDWPQSERDGYNDGAADPDQKQQVGPQINTVANAFYFRALQDMAKLATALGKADDARDFEARAAQVSKSFNASFFDAGRGIYIDGKGSNHASLHANMFALDFGLVPADKVPGVADFVQGRGMACSVYGAQYLLESLYKAGRDDEALALMTSQDERSWWNMIRAGSTMTTEAWDVKFKPNLTWNHPWGAAPANIITRFLVGVRPLTPGYERILIAPQPGSLTSFSAKVPTARGPVSVAFNIENGYHLEIDVPENSAARVVLPLEAGDASQAMMDGRKVAAKISDSTLILEQVAPGHHVFEVR